MPFGISIAEVITTFNTVVEIAKLGVLVSGSGLVSIRIEQLLADEPNDYHYKELFDGWFDTILFEPLASEINTLNRPDRQSALLLHMTIGVAVIAIVLAVELSGLLAVTGAALAGHHYLGMTIDITSVYRLVVAFSILLAIVFMTHAKWRIQQAYAHI